MEIDFSYKWFREFCEDNGLNPDNELSKSAVLLARDRAVEMKKYIDAKETYDDNKGLHDKLDENINRLNNERIGHMLDALNYAETMEKIGGGFNEFVKRQLSKRARGLPRDTQDELMNLSPIEERVNDRWEQAMKGRAIN